MAGAHQPPASCHRAEKQGHGRDRVWGDLLQGVQDVVLDVDHAALLEVDHVGEEHDRLEEHLSCMKWMGTPARKQEERSCVLYTSPHISQGL